MYFRGLGVLIKELSGDDRGVEHYKKALGGKITTLTLDADEGLLFDFEDGYKIRAWDDGQSCCEYRHMTTDDDLGSFEGARLMGIELRDAPSIEDEDAEAHDVQFLLVNTDRGTFTVESHNEHNGYYGGFWIRVDER